MIYTVTANPSLDYVVTVPDFVMGKTNRTSSEDMVFGGKGINVSFVLKSLGFDSVALGFIAGFTGEELKRKVELAGISADFITLKKGFTRVNLKLKNADGTEINGQGPEIERADSEKLLAKLENLKEGDVLFLSGSIPKSLPANYYEIIMERLQGKQILTVVDATKNLLTNVLKYKPFLVKPNNHELGEIFGVELKTREDVIPYGKKLQEMGARNVLVSLAGEGAVLIDETGEIISAPAPKGELVNGVGAGDSMVAGFVAGFLKSKDYGKDYASTYSQAFRLAVASGSASAFSEELASKEKIQEVLETIKLQ